LVVVVDCAVAAVANAEATAIVGAVGVVVTAITARLVHRIRQLEAELISQAVKLKRLGDDNQQLIEQWHRAQHQDQLQVDIGGPRRVGLIDQQLKAVGVSSTGLDVVGSQYWHGIDASIRLSR
jgi:hypothetical protein